MTHTGLTWTGPAFESPMKELSQISLRPTGLAGASLSLNTLFIARRTLLFDFVVMLGALGLCSSWNTLSRSRWVPADIRLGAPAEISGSSRVFSLHSSTCFSVGTCKPVLDMDVARAE